MKKKIVLAKIETAKREIAQAEVDLDKALREIVSAPRAEKTAVSEVVKAAFTNLRTARVTLGELEEIVSTDPD